MTLETYLGQWMGTYVRPCRAANTTESYESALAHLSAATLATELDDLTPMQLQREINALAAVYSRQAQILFTVLAAALRRAQRLHLVQASPMLDCECPKHRTREICYLTEAEAVAYYRAARTDVAFPLLALMLCLGLRRNEARGVQAEDIRDGVLHLQYQRRGSARVPLKSAASARNIPIPPALLADLCVPAAGYLCDMSEMVLQRHHRHVMQRAGIDSPVTLHGLRHTCATLMVQHESLTTVQHVLGHAHFSVTADTYIHTDLIAVSRATSAVFSDVQPGRISA